MPRTGLPSDQLRQRIVSSARERVRWQGADKLRLTDVARDLGVSHAALYGHFEGKDGLLDAVTIDWLRELEESLSRVGAEKREAPARVSRWFLALHRGLRERLKKDARLFAAYADAVRSHRPFLRAHETALRDQLAALLREAMEKKQLGKSSPEKLAAAMLEATRGFHHPALLSEHAEEGREGPLEQLIELLLAGAR